MPRNRHAKKKTSVSISVLPTGQKSVSPKLSRSVARIDPTSEQDLKSRLIQLFVDSASLVTEVEFLDLEFDRKDALDVTNRHFRKDEKRLEAARKKSADEFKEVSDDVHIEIANELITPEFRTELQKRLQAMHKRLELEKDFIKLQMVVVLETALELNNPPISVTGLINQIYNRTIQQALQDYEEEQELFKGMGAGFNLSKVGPKEIFDLLTSPEKLKPVEAELSKNPNMVQRLEKQIWKMLDDFEKELEQGRVELELFTPQELVLPFERLQNSLGDAAQSFDVSKTDAQEQFFAVLNETIAEILTPEHWQKFYRDVQNTARKWVITRNKWGAALHAELGFLDKQKYEPNRFVMFAFWGQLRRLSAPQNSKHSKKRA